MTSAARAKPSQQASKARSATYRGKKYVTKSISNRYGTCKGGSMSASLNPFFVALRSTLMEMYLKFVPRKKSGKNIVQMVGGQIKALSTYGKDGCVGANEDAGHNGGFLGESE